MKFFQHNLFLKVKTNAPDCVQFRSIWTPHT